VTPWPEVARRQPSAVVVFVEFYCALLLRGVGLVHVERHIEGLFAVDQLSVSEAALCACCTESAVGASVSLSLIRLPSLYQR
jgi:hypothetical protein